MKKQLFIALGFFGTLLVAGTLFLATLPTLLSAKAPTNEAAIASRHQALTKFANVMDLVEKYNVDPLTVDEIIQKSLEGLLTNLDAHSSFLDAKHFQDMKVQTEGEFGGLGITVGMRDGALTIIAPIEGTPADKAGLLAEDIILKIESQSTLGMSIDDAVNLMRGKKGSPITITVVRKGEEKPFEVKLIRDIIKIDSVYAKVIDNDILYLRIVSFDKKVVEEVQKHLAKTLPNKKGIILDLRNNPGGLLDQAVGLVDLFVDKGIIVSQKGREKSEDREFKATSKNSDTKTPMVVLINAGSASASEIVSGALQDLKRAVVIGKKSFGKGSVQVIMPISAQEAVKLTIARYYLPSGRTIQAVGVTPDVEVDFGKVVKEEENGFAIKESELKNRLESELEKVDKKATPKKKKEVDTELVMKQERIDNDSQLKSALDIVKVLILTQK
ncbi:MAG: peptidase S41 [Sulfuricurvum sp. PC08-66]|nr:MAG: peptidase S41 [Sulfuricurvum sp. PC08-66]